MSSPAKNTVDLYNNFSDLQGNCKTNPEQAGWKLAAKPSHSRSEAPPRPNAVLFQTKVGPCNRMG